MNNTDSMNRAEIYAEAQARLTPKRYAHSYEVAEIAASYAADLGYDTQKAQIAGILHDIAREYTDEQNAEAIEKYSIKLNNFSREFKPNIHAVIGAAIAENEFGIHDADILNAIKHHVTGRPCMHTLEEIIYVADHIARVHTGWQEAYEKVCGATIEEAVYITLRYVIKYDAEHNKEIDIRTQLTFDWYLEKIQKRARDEEPTINGQRIQAFDDEIDELIELHKKQRVNIGNVENLRDIGGYTSTDGRAIRKNKILRSGNLDKFTPDDYQKLAELGVNYVVDLRAPREKEQHIESGIPGIQYINVPFDVQSDEIERNSFYSMLREKYDECSDPEEAAWVASRYFNTFDMDDLYTHVLSDQGSCEKIRRILNIMLQDDCTGLLVFCQYGKDRTGIVICIIMCLLGVDPETILKDYKLSMVPYYAIATRYFTMLSNHKCNQTVLNKVMDVLCVDEERVKRLNENVLSRFADYGHYLDPSLCFSDDEERRFKDKFLA